MPFKIRELKDRRKFDLEEKKSIKIVKMGQ
jgi:hypothetical protein